MKWLKKLFLSILILLLIVSATFFVLYKTGFFSRADVMTALVPKADRTIVNITHLNRDRSEMYVKMRVYNPTAIHFIADSVTYRFYVSGTEVLNTNLKRSISIKGHDSAWIVLPGTFYMEKLLSILRRCENEKLDTITYRLETDFYTSIMKKTQFSLTVEQKLPLFHPLEIEVRKIETDSVRRGSMYLRVHTYFSNRNVFNINVQDIRYSFAIGEHQWTKGSKPGMLQLSATSDTMVIFPLKVSLKEIGKSAWEILRRGKNVPYRLDLRMIAQSKSYWLDDCDVSLATSGTIAELYRFTRKDREDEPEAQEKTEGESLSSTPEYFSDSIGLPEVIVPVANDTMPQKE
jgi:LEA14-like dessication related protein